uniref:Ycf1 protein n=1 Tax=Lactuca tetrantha TaxID=1941388 RepID=UPI0021CCDADC|nr:Ycf1 protein [Lactuca tetrantha]UWM99208.1 Ycf1 protein [Lactuca tetrantha]
MILKSFLLGNLVSLCMKIINSVVVVGLYYGFLTTFSIGPSYLFLLRAHIMEEGEEGTEKKVSATTGFITGQLIMFISIYYAPLHLALGRPHTITVLALPYLLFHFFCNTHKHFFDYGSTNRNSMRNLSIQCVFLNNLIFQLFNHFILPSSMLARLVNIFMFQCNSKMIFVTSSFVGWIMGHILLMKSIGFLLVWIRKNRSIRKYIRSNKSFVSELTNSMSIAGILNIFLFVTCVYYLGRMPLPIISKKLNKLAKIDQAKLKNNTPVSDMYKNQEDLYLEILEKKAEEKSFSLFEKPILTFFFDYNRWNRPLRYIRKINKKLPVRKETSQYFFYTCQSDGKKRISFTYPPSLSTFGEMIARRISLSTLEKLSTDELYTEWLYSNKEKNNNLNNEFINRIEALETAFLSINILETKTRLCKVETEKKKNCLVTKKNYLVKMDDPFLTGMYRGRINKLFSSSTINEISIENDTKTLGLNKIHYSLIPYPNSPDYKQKIDPNSPDYKQKIEKIQAKIDLNNRLIFIGTTFIAKLRDKKNSSGINEIGKKPPRWSYKLINELHQKFKKRRKEQGIIQGLGHQLRTRKSKHIDFLNRSTRTLKTFKQSNKNNSNIDNSNIDLNNSNIDNSNIDNSNIDLNNSNIDNSNIDNSNIDLNNSNIDNSNIDNSNIDLNNSNIDNSNIDNSNIDLNNSNNKDLGFISYLEEPDFRRSVIKGSMRAQRRKLVIWGPYQGNPHSPLFLEKKQDFPFTISDLIKLFFNIKDRLGKKSEFEILNKQSPPKRNNQEDVMEFWETIPHGHKTRGILLLAQSTFRKYIKLPLLIISKNIVRILLRQSPEWDEDFQDWNREIYLKCSSNGLQFSKTKFPKNWLSRGFQIKILYPFHLKPWHRSKLRLYDSDRDLKQQEDFDSCFLTTLGMETEHPFGPPRKTPSFFESIFKDIDYKVEIRKLNFRVRRILKKIKKKEAKAFFFIKQKIKELLKGNQIPLFIPREIYESSETQTEKDSIMSNQIIHESLSQILSTGWTNYSQAQEEMKHRIDRRKTIRNEIEIMKKNKINNAESSRIILKILKIKNIELLVKFFIEKIYIEIFLCIINMRRIPLQLFIESTKKILDNDKYINNNETNQERINKTKQNKIDFILSMTIKRAFDNLRNSKRKSDIFFDLSYLSQKYVFFKLSQTQIINFNKLRSILQYNGPSFFLKTEIRDFFVRQGIFHSELRHNKLPNYGMNPWKNWLRGHYQYDLSQITSSILIPQKWRNRINQCQTSQNKDLNKWYSSEKDQLLDSKKKQNSKVYLLPNKENHLKKNYRYDLLSYKYIHSETKNNYYIYKSSLETNNNQENSTRNKEKFFSILKNIPSKNYLGKSDIIYMEKNKDRKFLYKINKNIKVKPKPNKDQIKDKIQNNGLFYLPIDSNFEINSEKVFFNWMGMNEKILILNCLISNPKVFFFPKFVRLYHKYKEKPWFIPSKLLLFNLNINSNFSENQKINGKQEEYFFKFSPSNSKQYFELNNQNNIEEYFLESGDLPSQLRWAGRFNQLNQKIMNNIQIYGLLLSLINVRKISISYIQRKEMDLDIMSRNLNLTQLMKTGILILEPARLSLKNDGQFFMYQIIGISLVHKSKHQSNKRYQKQKNVAKNIDKKNSDLLVPETILSSRRRRELRILISFNLNLKNNTGVDRNTLVYNENKIKKWNQFLDENQDFDIKKNELIKFKFFFWPNSRLEDLACMNRYWFDTNNGSRLSMLRIYMYP